MFVYKYCSKCQKRNHKTNSLCTRCGDQLLNEPKFGKNVFAVALSAVIILSAAGVYAGNSYLNQKSENNNQLTTQEQNTAPKQGETKPTTNQDATAEEVKSEPTPTTSTKAPTKTQATPAPVAAPVCDELQKQIYTQTFTVNFNDAKAEMKRLTDEVFAKKNYNTQEAELDGITNDFIAKTNLYYSQYLQNMKSINCPAEQLLELKK